MTPSDASLQKTYPTSPIPLRTPTSRPLKLAQVEPLVAGHRAGKSTKELALEFGINLVTDNS